LLVTFSDNFSYGMGMIISTLASRQLCKCRKTDTISVPKLQSWPKV